MWRLVTRILGLGLPVNHTFGLAVPMSTVGFFVAPRRSLLTTGQVRATRIENSVWTVFDDRKPYSESIKRLTIRLKDGTRIAADIYFTRDPDQFPVLLLFRTGSAWHNAHLSVLAREQGMQFGIDGLKRHGQQVPCASEADVFAALGLGYCTIM